jgi:hypothetical protein
VAKGVQELTVEYLAYGLTYAFTVRLVDTNGNKSIGSIVIVSMARVVDDLNLAQYITAPVANAAPDTRAISGPQYTGTLNWFKVLPTSGAFSGNFAQNSAYQAVVTLTANAGYTFAGLGTGNNVFTFSGAGSVVTALNGVITVNFPVLGPVWYVAHYGSDNAAVAGDTTTAPLLSVNEALARIAVAHTAAKPTGLPSATIVVIGTSGDNRTITINDGNDADTYPPITLRGMGPTQAGILTADKGTTDWPSAPYRVLNILNGAEVTLGNDLTITGGGKRSPDVLSGAGVQVAKSVFTMNGGIITGNTTNTTSGTGGGVFIQTNSHFTMNGGTISNNYAVYTGGVGADNSSFTMNGGTITNNTSHSAGGGVRMLNNSTFTMNSGTISGNASEIINCGGVFIERSTFIMEGGSITGNTAFMSAAGVGLGTDGAFTMNSGSIADNTARQLGGGVLLDGAGSAFTMQGGIIAGNTAGTGGGGVAVKAGVFTKAPAVEGNASGIIYGSDGGANSNIATLGVTNLENWGHAVYIEAGPKSRETTVTAYQSLDSTAADGWAE